MTDGPNLRYNDLLEITRLPLSIANAECMNADLEPGFAKPGFPKPGFTEPDFPDFFENEMLMNININHKAPEFTLHDENGNDVSLKGLKGKVVVLYFYPRADTPGCTIEACSFRDTYKQIQKTGAVLLGISPDTPKAQKKFQEKFKLPFSLLADADKKVAEAYGVVQEKNMYGKKVMGIARTTFVIGPDGKIQHIFPKVKPEGHAVEVLAYLKESAKGAA
jgi:thioredoxin-dependent peroxiredoxin